MKKVFLVLALTQVCGSFAQAGIDPEMPLTSVVKIVSKSQLPGGCTASLVDRTDASGNKRFLLILNKGAKSTSLEARSHDIAYRTVDGDILTIHAGEKGTTPSIVLTADFHNKILDLAVNDLECK